MDDVREDRDSGARWERVATGFTELGDLLCSGFTDPESREKAREELRRAWSEFAAAAQGLGQALGGTVTGPETRAGARNAFRALADAIEATVRDVAAGTAARARQRHGQKEAEAR